MTSFWQIWEPSDEERYCFKGFKVVQILAIRWRRWVAKFEQAIRGPNNSDEYQNLVWSLSQKFVILFPTFSTEKTIWTALIMILRGKGRKQHSTYHGFQFSLHAKCKVKQITPLSKDIHANKTFKLLAIKGTPTKNVIFSQELLAILWTCKPRVLGSLGRMHANH